DFVENVTSAGFKGCKLSPFVCRVKDATYTFAGNQYKLEKHLERSDALHGVLYDRAFELISEQLDANGASITLKYSYNKEDPGYPFSYDCVVTWKLEKDNKLRVTTECINQDEGLIPMQDGWHPYFDLGTKIDALHLEFQSMEMVEFDQLIPTGKMREYDEFNSLKKLGETVFDTCFTINLETCQPMCVLRNVSRNIQVEIHPTVSYPYLQLYTPEHRNSIAIENLSGVPDAFNNGMGVQTLEPGQSSLYEVVYKIGLLK
ncbi:MAG: aldose 1-epimerase, partial [Ginsengibacter sp.]